MARIVINGQDVEAPEGAPLVEVIKESGVWISNLCYLDGLPPYAGCRTCLVEIEGARGLQLSCTTSVREGMVVRTDTEEVKEARQAVIALINSNHADRCLTCHRRIHCKPGDICLRDDVVTHRCLTCSKNYRCELQTSNELAEMWTIEPFDSEDRSYYMRTEQPPADRANPYLEFDPQMCILCTRCVRACEDLRHTEAIGLAGRGWSTRIAFGAGGAVHESTCDFCGSCIDVCPTATLMEKPNKWVANTNHFVKTTCTYCSVGCSIQLGVRGGVGVIVRPDRDANPVSLDQLCVRGRFHYDAISNGQRLGRPLARQGAATVAIPWDEALDLAVERLAQVRREHGAAAIAFLGSPMATTEENYLLARLAKGTVGSNAVDSSAGPVAEAVAGEMRAAFGTERLPNDMTELWRSRTIFVAAGDLEESHNVACLRIKDAAVRNGAQVVVLASRYGELCDFATVWLRPHPGQEAATMLALAQSLLGRPRVRERAAGLSGLDALLAEKITLDDPALARAVEEAAAVLAEDPLSRPTRPGPRRHELTAPPPPIPGEPVPYSFVYAPPPVGAAAAAAQARGIIDLALLCLGPAEAARRLHVLPTDANTHGMRDAGVGPGLLPGERAAVEAAWGGLASGAPLSFPDILQGMRQGRVKALVALRDNPLMGAPDRTYVESCLKKLDFLLVIDEVLSDTARVAHLVLPDVGVFAKDGTITSGDRRVLRQHAATEAVEEAWPAWRILSELGSRLAAELDRAAWPGFASAASLMDELASLSPLYAGARYGDLISGVRQPVPLPVGAALLPVAPPPARQAPGRGSGPFALITGRTLYTSWEAATIHSPEADRLHREEFVEVAPSDAERLGLADGAPVTLVNGHNELTLRAKVTDHVLPGSVFVPLLYDGGAVMRLLGRRDGASPARVSLRPAGVG